MTIKELKEKIKHLPDDMDVMISQNIEDDGLYGMAETAEVESVLFQAEDIPKEEWPEIECLIIAD